LIYNGKREGQDLMVIPLFMLVNGKKRSQAVTLAES